VWFILVVLPLGAVMAAMVMLGCCVLLLACMVLQGA